MKSDGFAFRIKQYFFEHGTRHILNSLYRKLFIFSFLFSVYLLVATPFLFNDFNYNIDFRNRKFASLVTDSGLIKENLKPENEKKYSGQLFKTEYSICYIHGFSASRKELEPVISNVAKLLKANIFFTRLAGHGYVDSNVLSSVKAQDWINDSLECLEVASRTGKKVILIGTSMGATLATLVAGNTKYNIHTLVLISPFFGLKDKKSDILAGYYGGLIANYVFKGHRKFQPQTEEQEKYWSTSYPASVLKPVMMVRMALKDMNLSKLKMPVFLAYSKKDEILDLKQIDSKYEQIQTQKRIDADPSYKFHILAGNIVNPIGNAQLQKNMYSFIKANK